MYSILFLKAGSSRYFHASDDCSVCSIHGLVSVSVHR